MKAARLLVVLTLVLFGCWDDEEEVDLTPPEGFEYIRHNGMYRFYRVYVPADLEEGEQLPMVMVLHGATGTSEGIEATSQMSVKAAAEHFVAVYPDGSGYPQHWNAGGPFHDPAGGVDDVGFISALIDTIATAYPVDLSRVYIAGFSNGAWMTYRLAAEIDDKVAAVATLSGQRVSIQYNGPHHPVPLIHFHATNDPGVLYTGGYLGGYEVPHVDTVVTRWAYGNGCNMRPDTVYNTDGVLGLMWSPAVGPGAVALYRTTRNGHSWPTTNNSGISATDVMWDFFKTQRKPTLH